MARPINIKFGSVYGRLSVIREGKPWKTPCGQSKRRMWCKCKCGTIRKYYLAGLRNGKTKSCGCLSKENSIKRNTTHGKYGTRIYRIWASMKARCLNKNAPNYKNYGGREIKVYERWNKFENFNKDMKDSYEEHVIKFGEINTSIDRINNNGNYSPENCRWATAKEQCNNQRKNRNITFGDKTMTMKQWAEKTGVEYKTLSNRLRIGWSIKRALTEPTNIEKRNKTKPNREK